MNGARHEHGAVVRNGVRIVVVAGDVAAQADADAVVNAANAELRPGGGVAGALHRAAGPGLEREAVPLGPIRPGEAVVTGGHDLPNRWVVHALGPVYGVDEPSEALLASAHREALAAADRVGARGVAVPAISTGAFGYPFDDGARVAARTALAYAAEARSLREIRFVLFTPEAARRFGEILNEVAGDPPTVG